MCWMLFPGQHLQISMNLDCFLSCQDSHETNFRRNVIFYKIVVNNFWMPLNWTRDRLSILSHSPHNAGRQQRHVWRRNRLPTGVIISLWWGGILALERWEFPSWGNNCVYLGFIVCLWHPSFVSDLLEASRQPSANYTSRQGKQIHPSL